MQHYILYNPQQTPIMKALLEKALSTHGYKAVSDLSQIADSEEYGLLIMSELDWLGQDLYISNALQAISKMKHVPFKKCGLIVFSEHYWFTKRYAQQMTFILNQKGAFFPGQSLFEVLPEFENLKTWQKHLKLPMDDVVQHRFSVYLEEWSQRGPLTFSKATRKILVLHASHYHVSNTLRLWEMVETHLQGWTIQRMGLQNGTITDCKGCAFKTCVHYAQSRSCYYGGQMTMEILPAIEESDVIVWVSPNYNDSLSAMHAALINRLTVLYRRISLKDKAMYGVIVSGNSGCDSVACQLIGALNINKGFYLPQHAFLTAIANSPGSIEKLSGVQERAMAFAKQIDKNHPAGQ